MAGSGVVVLAGGTGGAKLGRGMLDVAGDDLTVIANTGDDIEIYDAYVSPDPDLCSWWLADRIDPRGWGLRDDTFEEMERLRAAGEDVWFDLGDEDLSVCRTRASRLAEGARLTETLAELGMDLGLRAAVRPMSDAPVRTQVKKDGRWRPFQEFMIRDGGKGPVEGVEYEGVGEASAPPEVLEAIAGARAIVIGPSNPVISIGPILAVPGLPDALRDAPAAVVAVSPIVGGAVVKGPTQPFMAWAGHELSAAGIANAYTGVIDGVVTDEGPHDLGLPALQTGTLMTDGAERRRVADETLAFAEALSP